METMDNSTAVNVNLNELASKFSKDEILSISEMQRVRGGDGDGGGDLVIIPPPPGRH
jgi:hypothetical protein